MPLTARTVGSRVRIPFFSACTFANLCVCVALCGQRIRWVDTPSNAAYHMLTRSTLSEVNSELERARGSKL